MTNKQKKVYCKNCEHFFQLKCQVIGKGIVTDKKAEKAFGDKFLRDSQQMDFRKLNKNNDCKFYEKYIKPKKVNPWYKFWAKN